MTDASPRVRTGLDVWLDQDFENLRGQAVGAIVNPTSVDCDFRHLADLLAASSHVHLKVLFGPEHGIRGEAQDMIGVEHAVDRKTNVPVHSLYGDRPESLRPTAEQLEGLDTLVFDVQDVGSRYYTFAATMKYAMEAAAERGLRFVVLDRPNPIGGVTVEGPTVSTGHESFVSSHPLPIRHGLTVAELAWLFRKDGELDLDLEVVTCQGWERRDRWEATGLPWIAPSPNMPTPATALVYPGGCLIEGTNLSEGRGTTRPFELCGAPWLDGSALAERLTEWRLPGAAFRACGFLPMFQKHAGTLCQGVQVHVTEPDVFRPTATYVALLLAAREQDPDRFAWRTEPYEFIRQPIAIDLLFGSSRERERIEAGRPWTEIADAWSENEAEFRNRREESLLYG